MGKGFQRIGLLYPATNKMVFGISIEPMIHKLLQMKRIILIGFLLLGFGSYAQEEDFSVLNQYKYIIVKTSMYEGARDPYNASTYLRLVLFGLGYNVIPENELSWPEELRLNPCLGIQIDVITTPKVVGDYVTDLNFINCYNIDVLNLSGKGSGIGSNNAFHNAIDNALRRFKRFEHQFNPDMALLPRAGKSQSRDSLMAYFETAGLEDFEGIYTFSSGPLDYTIGIRKVGDFYNAYILESEIDKWIAGEVKGIFEMSNRPGLFSVEWYLDDKSLYDTFGYINDDQSLTIEFKKPGDEYQPLTIKKVKE